MFEYGMLVLGCAEWRCGGTFHHAKGLRLTYSVDGVEELGGKFFLAAWLVEFAQIESHQIGPVH
jgi:hypothetical protein